VHSPSHDSHGNYEEHTTFNQSGIAAEYNEDLVIENRKLAAAECPSSDGSTPQFLKGFKIGFPSAQWCQYNTGN
jgi:hypothetical protein